MGKKTSDPVAEAINQVVAALAQLEDEAKRRVLKAAGALFGLGDSSAHGVFALSREGVEAGPVPRSSQDISQTPQSLNELILEKKPVTNSQRLALFAFYRERVEGKQRFARGDLLPYFAKAREPKPGNFDRDFTAAVKEGWFHEDDADSYLTSRGVEAVEAGFGGKAKPRGSTAKVGRGKR